MELPKSKFAFLTLPRYSMIALSSAVEALRMANMVTEQAVYDWSIVSVDGKPVPASNDMQLAPTLGSATVLQSSSSGILHTSVAVSHQAWRTTLYDTNLLDKQEILVPPNQGTAANDLGMLANDYVVNPPREIGVRVGYSF